MLAPHAWRDVNIDIIMCVRTLVSLLPHGFTRGKLTLYKTMSVYEWVVYSVKIIIILVFSDYVYLGIQIFMALLLQ